MAHQTAAGATIGVSLTPPASHTEAGFDALTLVSVGEITNIGEFGKEFALVTHNPLASRGTKKGKGSYNNGSISPALAFDPDDAGQIAMQTALDSDDAAYFGITLQDGTIFYLEGLVMSLKTSVGGNDDVVTGSTNIEITDQEILRKAAP